MIQIQILAIPEEWREGATPEENTELDEMIGLQYMASDKGSYITLSSSGDNIPKEYTDFIMDLDGEMTYADYFNLSQQ